MPIFEIKNVSPEIKVGVWKITETEGYLMNGLKDKGIPTDSKPVSLSKSRVTQWLATRLLLSEMMNNVSIVYDELGKPSLDNGWFLSISHSNEFVAIIINAHQDCGIDIERISEKVKRIKHKFLNPKDLKNIISLEELTLYWGAKEALYKYYGKKEVLFIENLFIENYSAKKESFVGIINLQDYKVKLPMTYEKIEDYVLVYTL
jgi:4'-phosphopantetheinyl transferase EntD